MTAILGTALIIAIAPLYGATIAPSPRDGVQPVEFMVFGINLYGLAAAAVLFALDCIATLGSRRPSWALGGLAGSGSRSACRLTSRSGSSVFSVLGVFWRFGSRGLWSRRIGCPVWSPPPPSKRLAPRGMLCEPGAVRPQLPTSLGSTVTPGIWLRLANGGQSEVGHCLAKRVEGM